MSFPNVLYKGYGYEKTTSSAKIGNLPLGQLMILPDGRKFRHAQAGSVTDLEPGAIVSTTAGVTGHGHIAGSGLLASATITYNAVSATTVYLTSKSVAFTTDQYADGFLNVQGPGGSTYIGHVYRIKSNKSAAVSSLLEIELEKSDGLKVAFAAGSTSCSLRKSQYKDAIVHNVATVIAPVMGVTPVAVTKSYYFWVQRGGESSVQTSATTVTDGLPVMATSAEAGSAKVAVGASVATNEFIGRALETVTATEAVLVDLGLE